MIATYYAVIPAEVLHSHQISSTAKILYAHLSTLAQKEGFAFPRNKYLSEAMDISASQVTRLITELEDCGFLKRDVINGRRILWIGSAEMRDQLRINADEGQQKCGGGVRKNADHNSIKNNSNNKHYNVIVFPWQTVAFEEAWNEWRDYKKSQFKKWYKRPQDEQAALMRLQKLVGDDEQLAIESIQNSISNLYQGLFLPHNKKTKTNDKSTLADALRKAGHL